MGIFIEKTQSGLELLHHECQHIHEKHPSQAVIKGIPLEDGEVYVSGPATLEATDKGWLITGRGAHYNEIVLALTSYMERIPLPEQLPVSKPAKITTENNIFS